MSDTRFKIHDTRYGFTLIELLITIAIIGILSTIGFGSVRTFQQQARDTQRKNDLRQYQIALENYASSNNSLYPGRITPRDGADGVAAAITLCADLGSFISGCPQSPGGVSDWYRYESDGPVDDGNATALNWVLWTQLERSTNYWIVCSNGKSGENPAGWITGGACPL